MKTEKHCLLAQLSEDAASVRNEVERMRALLRAVDAEEKSEDTEFKEWLFQVQDVAYDAEDILAKFKQIIYEANHSKNNGFLAKVRKKLYSRKDAAVELDQIASELETIQERIKKVVEVQKYQSIYADIEQGLNTSSSNDSQGDERIEEVIDFVGIGVPKQELISWITSADEGKKVLSVLGKPGTGKTSLVEKAFDGEFLMKHFDFHMYITATKSSSSIDLLQMILEGMFFDFHTYMFFLTIENWRDIISRSLQENKYIIFVDEIVDKNVWQTIKYAFPDNQKGSRVVIITSSHEVAEDVSLESGSSVIRLEPLSQEDSWILFCKKAFKNHSCPPQLMEISRNIVNLLDGVPLALHMIGGAMRKKKDTIEEWEMFYHQLLEVLKKSNNSEGIQDFISIGWRNLPLYLKPCFLYLSIFPQVHEIEKATLLRLWAAEGLLDLKEGETIDEVGERYINELVNRSLVQIEATFGEGTLYLFSIQHLVHDFIFFKGREQNIATTDLSCNNKVRRLLFHYSLDDNNQTSTSFEHLRSLVTIGCKGSLSESFLSDLLYSGKKHMLLKVVDLKGAQLNKIPKGIFNMFHLQYLNLSYTNIATVPRSIGKLENLHFLNLKHTLVKKLPKEILKLQQLEHLLVNRVEYGSILGCAVPRNLGTLVSLKKLADVKANNKELVKGIGNLTQLTMLGITRLRRKDVMNLCLSLQKLINLKILSITALQCNEVIDLQHSASPFLPFLRTLSIGGRMEKLPLWIASHHSLVIVQLQLCALRETPLCTLEDLPNLSELILEDAYEGEELLFQENTFQSLKILNLKGLRNLQRITIKIGAMPLLEELNINYTELQQLPCGIEHLTKLKVLRIENTNLRSLSDEDCSKVAHIPLVLII